MDQSKQRDGAAIDGSHSVEEPDGSLFTDGSKVAGHDGAEGHANKYAEASQAREIGRKPRPIDGPHSARSKPTERTNQKNVVPIAKSPAAKKTGPANPC